MASHSDNRLDGFALIEDQAINTAVKEKALSALGSMVKFYDRSRDRWLVHTDFVFLANILVRLAISGSARRALAGDQESDQWFPDEGQVDPGEPEAGVDESLGKKRGEAALIIQNMESSPTRSLATEILGTALLLQMFEHVYPKEAQDFVFLVEGAVHAFSSPEVLSIWVD